MLSKPAAFPPTDQPPRVFACFGKAMAPEVCARRGRLEAR